MIIDIRNRLKEKGLKVTPQRVAIYEAIVHLHNHPTADDILSLIKDTHPNISLATIYKVLEIFVKYDLIRKVKTEEDSMRYDPSISKHHHLYCAESNRIQDFEDENLNALIGNYFKKNKIRNFKIQDIQLQITGKFK